MDKYKMREWTAALEEVLDKKLKKWKKHGKMENGEAISMTYQYEQTYVNITIFWEDHKEVVKLQYLSPRADHFFHWNGLNDKSLNLIMDRVGNLAQMTMHPIIDPSDIPGLDG